MATDRFTITSSSPTSATPGPDRVGEPSRPPKRRRPWWVIAAVVGGLLLVGGAALVGWRLLSRESRTDITPLALGEPCGSDIARPCGEGLLCANSVQQCLLAGGASCTQAQANLCASNECEDKANVCAIPLGGDCIPGAQEVPCPRLATCEPTMKKCVIPCSANQGTPCNCGGIIQCDGTCSVAVCIGSCQNGRCCSSSADPGCAPGVPPRKPDFNEYILRAIDLLYQRYHGQGYDINSAFTHDLDYSEPAEIRARPNPPATMCVAAVSEVVIVALRLYVDETHDRSVFDKLPAESWMRGRLKDIRPYMFQYDTEADPVLSPV